MRLRERTTRLLGTASALCALATAAHAVYQDASGLGQALVYPYYTARSVDGNAFNTYLSVVNTTADAKVVRVTIREGRAGKAALRFNLYLSPRDMWTGAVVPADGEATMLISADRSCTNPSFGAAPYRATFSADGYSGPHADGLGEGIERGREGYVEVIEMATLTGAAAQALTPDASGVPASCAAVQGAPLTLEGRLAPPTGGLTGTLTLINVASGRDFTVSADALAGLTSQPFYRNFDDPYPDFDAAEVTPVSQVVAGTGSYRLLWATGLEAVSSVLMTTSVSNEFVLDWGTSSSTEWVMAFPTRRLHHAAATPSAPFDEVATRCSEGGTRIFDRATRTRHEDFIDDLQPAPPRYLFCAAAVIARFEHGAPFGSPKAPVTGSTNLLRYGRASLSPPAADVLVGIYQNGHAEMQFRIAWAPFPAPVPTPAPGLSSQAGSSRTDLVTGETTAGRFRVEGLPVTGFMLRTFSNGTLTCDGGLCQGNYGGAYSHKVKRSVVILP